MAKPNSTQMAPGGGGGARGVRGSVKKSSSARKNSNIVGRVVNKNLKDHENHDIKNRTPSTPNPSIRYNKQAMENAIKKANAPKGPSATTVRAREIERKITENNKRFGVGQSRPATKAETSATTAKYKATTARTMSSDKVAKNSVKVKPAAKPKPNKPDAAKTTFKNDSSRNRASDAAMKRAVKDEFSSAFRNTDPSFASKLGERAALNTKLKRKPNLNIKNKSVGGMRGGGLGGLNKANR